MNQDETEQNLSFSSSLAISEIKKIDNACILGKLIWK